MKNRTTIQVEKELLKELRKKKIYDRETYNEMLKRLIKDKRRLVG